MVTVVRLRRNLGIQNFVRIYRAVMIGLNPEIRKHLVGVRHFWRFLKNLIGGVVVRSIQVSAAAYEK